MSRDEENALRRIPRSSIPRRAAIPGRATPVPANRIPVAIRPI
jgi:hypothetical protein